MEMQYLREKEVAKQFRMSRRLLRREAPGRRRAGLHRGHTEDDFVCPAGCRGVACQSHREGEGIKTKPRGGIRGAATSLRQGVALPLYRQSPATSILS